MSNDSKPYIITNSLLYDDHRTNPIKGYVMQSLLHWTFDETGYTKIHDEITLEGISRFIAERQKRMFRVVRGVAFVSHSKEGAFRDAKGLRWDEVKNRRYIFSPIHSDPEYNANPLIDFEIIDKAWPIGYTDQDGQFQVQWSNSVEVMENFLLDKKLITPYEGGIIGEKSMRPDMVRFDAETVLLIESKNLEKTGLNFSCMNQGLVYNLSLVHNGIPAKVQIIVNGRFAGVFVNGRFVGKYDKVQRLWYAIYKVWVDVYPIEDWLKNFAEKSGKRVMELESSIQPRLPKDGWISIHQINSRDRFLNIRTADAKTTRHPFQIYLKIVE